MTGEPLPPRPRFLSSENLLYMHENVINNEGGTHGLRDIHLLESAAAMPHATMFGAYLHEDLAAMAAAYLFHLSQNHAFLDGNKRVAAFSSLAFLAMNGAADEELPDKNEMERVTLAVASGQMSKEAVTVWMRKALPNLPPIG